MDFLDIPQNSMSRCNMASGPHGSQGVCYIAGWTSHVLHRHDHISGLASGIDLSCAVLPVSHCLWLGLYRGLKASRLTCP